MTLQEFKDVVQLHKLADTWIEDYQQHNIGVYSSKQKKQLKEMKQLLAKTRQLIEKQSGDLGTDDKDWKTSYEMICELAKSSTAFLSCFGEVTIAPDSSAPISTETALLAIKLKKMTASWYGRFSDEINDDKAVALVATIHERSKQVLSAPKTTESDTATLCFYHSNSKRCRKMRKNVDFVSDRYEGLLNVEQHLIEDEDKAMHKLGIETLPTLIFKRGTKEIATHKGSLSISALEQKIGLLLEGANFSDSSSVKSLKDMKSVTPKELYAMGEYLLFYFETTWCGHCKKTTPDVKELATQYSKVHFECITIDGSHKKHKSFGVTEVPCLVFVHDGRVIGRRVGYTNPTTLQDMLEQFAVSNKRKIKTGAPGASSVIDQEEHNKKEENRKQRRIKDKT